MCGAITAVSGSPGRVVAAEPSIAGYGERGAEPVQNVTFTTTIPADI